MTKSFIHLNFWKMHHELYTQSSKSFMPMLPSCKFNLVYIFSFNLGALDIFSMVFSLPINHLEREVSQEKCFFTSWFNFLLSAPRKLYFWITFLPLFEFRLLIFWLMMKTSISVFEKKNWYHFDLGIIQNVMNHAKINHWSFQTHGITKTPCRWRNMKTNYMYKSMYVVFVIQIFTREKS